MRDEHDEHLQHSYEYPPRQREPPPPSSATTAPPPSSEAVHDHLEMRLQDLKRDWDAYKTGRSSAPRHRRLPSSAVTAAEPDACHISLLRRSPRARRLVSSLQQTGSADVPEAGPCDNEDASSACSVEGGYSVATYSSCSCSCSCPILCCGGYSTSSSCTGTTVPPFSSDIDGGRARKMMDDEGKWAASKGVWISAVIVLVVVGFAAMIILVFGMDEGHIEYQVPT